MIGCLAAAVDWPDDGAGKAIHIEAMAHMERCRTGPGNARSAGVLNGRAILITGPKSRCQGWRQRILK
jgi:hypothetical protein